MPMDVRSWNIEIVGLTVGPQSRALSAMPKAVFRFVDFSNKHLDKEGLGLSLTQSGVLVKGKMSREPLDRFRPLS
jgi:hypothetical protein